MSMFLLLGMMLVFYFFFIRPQSKKQKDQRKFEDTVGKGDQIVTGSGIIGKITKVDGQKVTLLVDSKMHLTILKSAISRELTQQVFNDKSSE